MLQSGVPPRSPAATTRAALLVATDVLYQVVGREGS